MIIQCHHGLSHCLLGLPLHVSSLTQRAEANRQPTGFKSHERDQIRCRGRPVKDPEDSRKQTSGASSGPGMSPQHLLSFLAHPQKPVRAPLAHPLMLLQVSLISDYPKLRQKEPWPFTATESQGSGGLTPCHLGQRDANMLGNEISFQVSPILKNS